MVLERSVVRGDFEGIAVLDDVIWLMTSDGDLYATAEGANGDRMTYAKHETGIGRECEPAWLMWRGTGGYSWLVDRAGVIELAR